MMENEDEMMKILSNTSSGVKVTIGNENEREAMNHLSLITSSYNLGLNQMGSIGLLGPTRMEYKKVITLLKGLSNEMSDLLNQVRRKDRSEEHTSELQSRGHIVCRLLLEKKKI